MKILVVQSSPGNQPKPQLTVRFMFQEPIPTDIVETNERVKNKVIKARGK